ncbi:hypothetical protein [Paraburkholderia phytofirmans]|uniref:hypothetical protein n=1 Tax=Paraburkholderia phytofirmans TaxID=261302 RepID=UPI001314D144|nr:hypothetical protein [Paraburkholderia phytofirmans]
MTVISCPNGLHVEQAADGIEILSPYRHRRTPDFDVGVGEVLREILGIRPVVRHRASDRAWMTGAFNALPGWLHVWQSDGAQFSS